MSKLTADQRSALQSARAKNRKLVIALGNAGAEGVAVPKNIVTKINAIEAFFAGLLDTSETTVKTNRGSKLTPTTEDLGLDEAELPEGAVADAVEELAKEAAAA